ncbi:MAG: hypothetical protein ACI93R_002322 [Flavobacteriales bacterium]|jgi:hypothetical protein
MTIFLRFQYHAVYLNSDTFKEPCYGRHPSQFTR